MRWRLVDRITSFEPWRAIAGRKAVSLEEYCLLEPLGRKGFLPETLALESCVELLRLLVEKSSDFTQASVLQAAEDFAFARAIGRGEVLEVSARVVKRSASRPTAGWRRGVAQPPRGA